MQEVTASGTAGAQQDRVRSAIEAADKNFADSFANGDAAAMAAAYADDAMVFPPNSDIIEGRALMESFWNDVMAMGIKGLTLDILEVDDLGETAIEIGKYSMIGPDGSALDKGKYLVVWKRAGGEWKIHRDIFNSSMPAAH